LRAELTVALGLLAVGCGDAGPDAHHCGPGIDTPPLEPAIHVPEGSDITYQANPPASGPHYFPTAEWDVYAQPVPRGNWVHNLEHGGIVLSYNCPDGCADDVASFVALRAERKPDRFGLVRVIVTPDPLMPRRLAALAWGWRWLSESAVDAPTVRCFIAARYDRAPESFP
jgi:hypothetical protein